MHQSPGQLETPPTLNVSIAISSDCLAEPANARTFSSKAAVMVLADWPDTALRSANRRSLP